MRKAPRGRRVDKIVSRKCGRPLALGKELDDDAQKFVKALRKAGTPINTAVILAAVERIITAKDRTLLVCNSGHIKLKGRGTCKINNYFVCINIYTLWDTSLKEKNLEIF